MPVFVTNLFFAYTASRGPELNSLYVGIAGADDWVGSYKETICDIESAILHYDVEVEGNKVTLARLVGNTDCYQRVSLRPLTHSFTAQN